MKDKLHLRWAIPSAVFVLAALPLLLLAFENDHQMATVFHAAAYWWAVMVHVLLLLIPVTVALLPREQGRFSERNIALGAWGLALVLALIGNVAGGIGHASGRTIAQVLDGAPTTASGLRQIVGAAGGLLIVALEFAVGRLAEANLARLFFGSPTSGDAPPAIGVDSERQGALPGASTHALTEQAVPRLSKPVDSARQASSVKGRAVKFRRRKSVNPTLSAPVDRQVDTSNRQVDTRQPAPVNPPMSTTVDAQVDTRQPTPLQIVINGIPAEMGEELIEAVEALRLYKNTRAAGEALGVSRTTISNRVSQAREIAPEWVHQQLGG